MAKWAKRLLGCDYEDQSIEIYFWQRQSGYWMMRAERWRDDAVRTREEIGVLRKELRAADEELETLRVEAGRLRRDNGIMRRELGLEEEADVLTYALMGPLSRIARKGDSKAVHDWADGGNRGHGGVDDR